MGKGHARYPIPAVLLARLAIAKPYQGAHLGERLLADAVRRIVEVSQQIGVDLVVVDALDDEAAGFYERYGFARWLADGHRPFAKARDLGASFATTVR